MSDGSPKLIAIDEETNHHVVHARGLGKADRPAYQPLDPVRKLMCLLSIFCVFSFPTVCFSVSTCRS